MRTHSRLDAVIPRPAPIRYDWHHEPLNRWVRTRHGLSHLSVREGSAWLTRCGRWLRGSMVCVAPASGRHDLDGICAGCLRSLTGGER